MSLKPVYVQFEDSEFYENPILGGDGWFVCFDHDAPPELVLEEQFYNKLINRGAAISDFLKKNISPQISPPHREKFYKGNFGIYRWFSYGGTHNIMRKSVSFFFNIHSRVLLSNLVEHGKKCDFPEGDCRLYEWGE